MLTRFSRIALFPNASRFDWFFNSYHGGSEPSGPAIPSTPGGIDEETPDSFNALSQTGDPLTHILIGIAAVIVGSFALAVYATRNRKPR